MRKPKLKDAFPDLYAEIDFENPKNAGVDFESLTIGNANQVIWWVHTVAGEVHSFDTSVHHRVRSHKTSSRGCRYCYNRVPTPRRSIEATHPDVASDWDYENNGTLTPGNVSAGSEKLVWWVCPRGHREQTMVINRVHRQGCPKCRPHASLEELRLYTEAMRLGIAVDYRFVQEQNEIDVYFPALKVGIELDGWWHKDRRERDRQKDAYFSGEGITVFHLRDRRISGLGTAKELTFRRPLALDDVKALFTLIYEFTGTQAFARYCEEVSEFDESAFLSIVPEHTAPKPGSSLQDKYPQIAKLWASSHNGTLTPDGVGVGSRFRVYWNCLREDGTIRHVFRQQVKKMVAGAGCSICHSVTGNAYRSLAIDYPAIAGEWDWERNKDTGETPHSLLPGSNMKVWWKGVHDGHTHRWRSTIVARVRGIRGGTRGCPICENSLVTPDNCLSTTHPEIAKEWDYSRNETTPEQIIAGTPDVYYWLCPKCGSSYDKSVRKRTERNQHCPYCGPCIRRVNATNCLSTTHPLLAGDWDDPSESPDKVHAGMVRVVRLRCRTCGAGSKGSLEKLSKRQGCKGCGKRYDAGLG